MQIVSKIDHLINNLTNLNQNYQITHQVMKKNSMIY